MASNAYVVWDRAGRPVTPCQPVKEIVAHLKATYPQAAGKFGWYADEAHYQAVPPLDHTPYSTDEWPVAVTDYVVFATDVTHRPDLGVDCRILAPYWLDEARAGRFKALKYLIWQGTNYDVRNGWRPARADGHFDHAHLSIRTDHRYTSLAGWPITPQKGDEDVFYLHNPQTQGVAISDGIRYRSIPDGGTLNTLQNALPGKVVEFTTDADLRRLGGFNAANENAGIDIDALAEKVIEELRGSWTGAEANNIKEAVKAALREGTGV